MEQREIEVRTAPSKLGYPIADKKKQWKQPTLIELKDKMTDGKNYQSTEVGFGQGQGRGPS